MAIGSLQILRVAMIVAAIAGGCSGSPNGTADAGLDAQAGVATLAMPAVSLAPGQETTMCVVLALPNDSAKVLRRVHSTITAGSHHLIAYRAPTGTPEQLTPTPCQPFSDITDGVSPVIIAESADAEVTYPDGVGLAIAAHQMVKLEEHFLNAGDTAIEASGTVDFTLADLDPALVAANLMFWGPQQFQIAPHAADSADYFHLVTAGVNVFGLTTHEHHFGTLATIELAASAGGDGTELYRNSDWEHPPLRPFDPALTFDGTQGLRLHCEWFNTSASVVSFGLSAATDEMCFFWAYYYPSHGFEQCNEQGCRMQ